MESYKNTCSYSPLRHCTKTRLKLAENKPVEAERDVLVFRLSVAGEEDPLLSGFRVGDCDSHRVAVSLSL